MLRGVSPPFTAPPPGPSPQPHLPLGVRGAPELLQLDCIGDGLSLGKWQQPQQQMRQGKARQEHASE